MDTCPYCARKVSGLELSARVRAARYHEDCRRRELGLPPEPWMPIRIALFLWEDALPLLWNALRAIYTVAKEELSNPLSNASAKSPRERSDNEAMKHRDLWL